MSIVQVRNLSKNFGDLKVLDNVSFSINKGEALAIIGPSGSGKSTLLRCLIDLEKAQQGHIIIEGNYLCKDGHYIPERKIPEVTLQMGMVFQSFNLFPHMTVRKNLMCAPLLLHKTPKEELETMCVEILTKVGLQDKIDEMPGKLSGGQKQRVAIARALMLNPKILLFDEPTSALDPELTQEVLEVIKALAREHMTMAIVTHEIGFAREAADRVLFIDNGNIVEEGNAKDVIDNPKHERTKAFLQKIY